MLTEQEKWRAVLHCDPAYDGRFLYGVKTTGVFCRPSCKSKAPLRENTEFFETIEEATAHGLRPCKRCRPDLLEYQPMLELLTQAKSIYDNYFDDSDKLALAIKQLGVSGSHLTRMFRQQLNMTPTEYLCKRRLERATQLLSETEASILTISADCGFGSLSTFYASFRKQYGMTPIEYRRQRFEN